MHRLRPRARPIRGITMMALMVAEKRCADCGEIKEISEFGPSKQLRDGLASYCYPCRREQNKGNYARWSPDQRLKHRQRVLRSRYGIEMELVTHLYEEQEGCCAICGVQGDFPTSKEKGRSRSGLLCIDHDHQTGVVRGLLCHNCNTGLGKLGDSIDRLVKAASYLVDRGGK